MLSARVDTRDASCSCECAGVVTSVGSSISDLQPGDRVVAMAPGSFATVDRFPRWAIHPLLSEEDPAVSLLLCPYYVHLGADDYWPT